MRIDVARKVRVCFTLLLLGGLLAAQASLAAEGRGQSLRLTMPPELYAVPGVPMSVYFDNLVLTESPDAYKFAFACEIGAMEKRRWTVTPSGRRRG